MATNTQRVGSVEKGLEREQCRLESHGDISCFTQQTSRTKIEEKKSTKFSNPPSPFFSKFNFITSFSFNYYKIGMASSNLAFELFTLPTQVDNGAFWNNLKDNQFFILQQAKTQKSGLMRSVLGTLQNV